MCRMINIPRYKIIFFQDRFVLHPLPQGYHRAGQVGNLSSYKLFAKN